MERRTLRLVKPWETAHGVVRERELVAIALEDEEGPAGYGEGAPLTQYDGVSVERVEGALERYRRVLAGAKDLTGVQTLEACRREDDLPQALAAIDMALWDRAGKRANRPIAELLTDDPARAVHVNATIGARERGGATEQAQAASEAGYECVKVKVGTGDDAARVAAVRAVVGPRIALRLDATGAWSVEEAVRAIEALAPVGLRAGGGADPRAARDQRGARARQHADRDRRDRGRARGARRGRGRRGVFEDRPLRWDLGSAGGRDARARFGAEPYVASNLDGPLGVAAALHAAAALASRGPVPACGLATLGMFEGIEDQLPVRRGRIGLPSAPGLGVSPL